MPVPTPPPPSHNWPDIIVAASSAAGVLGAPIAWIMRRAGQHKKKLEGIEMRLQHLEDISMTRAEMTSTLEHTLTAFSSVMQRTEDKIDGGFRDVRQDIQAVRVRLDAHIDKGAEHGNL